MPLRSLLFVPGNSAKMLEKALGTSPDALVPDLEDSVPPDEKAAARATVREFLPRLAKTDALVIPRVNSFGTPWLDEDLAAVVGPDIDGISIGKIHGPADIAKLSRLVGDLELRAGLPLGRTKLVPWLETAEAIVHAHSICKASTRIVAVAFGAEDFTHDLGIERLDDESQLGYARSALCVAARAAGVVALDTPYFKFRDSEGLRANALAAKRLGFKGKFAIHPAQVEVLIECFSPSPDEIAAAGARRRRVRGSGAARARLDVARRTSHRYPRREAGARAAPTRGTRLVGRPARRLAG